MGETARIVFEEDGYPRELISIAEMTRAIARDELRQNMKVVVYRPDAAPSSMVASDVPELRPIFGLSEPESAAEVFADMDDEVQGPRVEKLEPLDSTVAGRPENSLEPNIDFPLQAMPKKRLTQERSPTKADLPDQALSRERLRTITSRPSGGPWNEGRPAESHAADLIDPEHGVPLANHFVSHYAVFKGRETRSQYWSFTITALFVILVSFGISEALGAIVWLALIIPGWASAVRRLHDANISGWVLLVGLIPYLGAFILLILLLLPSSEEQTYGPIIQTPG